MEDPVTAHAPSSANEDRILRFRVSERAMHWSIAVPFMICWITAMILINVYNHAPDRPLRALFSWTHRISGAGLALLPFLAAVRCRKDYRVHLNNVKQAWLWGLSDIHWLMMMGLKTVFPRLDLPEAGKFNAAEKLNFMVGMMALPVFVVSGLAVWLPGVAYLPWLFHFYLGLLITPLMLGHIYMAVVNRDTRAGLSGMFSGLVDRTWARHHYGLWYREKFGTSEQEAPVVPTVAEVPEELVLGCSYCAREVHLVREWVLARRERGQTVFCPHCGEILDAPAEPVVDPAPRAPLASPVLESADTPPDRTPPQPPAASSG